ncbi:MAG TPA: conjugal transfer protein TraF [Vicinamibacterales bacterium]|nr:conjugal transfer protein TraF [Vicinamibacterales bacterium]
MSFESRASAQPTDGVGVRASGMAGAFTAVADDATASWWNPAGMAGGAYFNALIEAGAQTEPRSERTSAGDPQSASRANTRSFAVAFPALGLSYYRLRISEIQPQTSTGDTAPGRQEGGAAEVRLRSLVLNQFGASVGQSLGSHLVIGSTLKLVSAGTASQIQSGAAGSLDTADGIDPSREVHAGLDVGAMAVFGRARIGVMVRNVNEAEFGSGSDVFTLSRHARVGAALSSGTRGVIGSATVAVDADLNATTTVNGDERLFAAGGEAWTRARTFGVRGGVSVNTVGTRRTALSAGVSAAVKKGLYADGALTGGTDQGRHGLALGLRVTF